MSKIYVLQCKYKKWYVGETKDPEERFAQHVEGSGSQWTARFPPEKMVVHKKTGPDDEANTTLEYMAKYGIANVRGGPWVTVFLSQATVEQIQKQLWSRAGVCVGCGSADHWVAECPVQEEPARELPPAKKTPARGWSAMASGVYSWLTRPSQVKDESDDEGSDACFRCGREGHWAAQCYAKTGVDGKRL